jgi:Icc-related predicted phosphoesterase
VRLAQITDMHLPFFIDGDAASRAERQREYEVFEQTVFKAAAAADIIVLTGDFLNINWDELESVANEVTPTSLIKPALDSYLKFKNVLDESSLPYLVLPGNHDHESAFFKVFDQGRNCIEVQGYTVVRFCDREGPHHVPWRKDEELKRFIYFLKDTAKTRQIHVQHFLLSQAPDDDYPYSYGDYDKLQQKIIDSHKVVLALSGHYHKGTGLIEKQGSLFTVGPASCEPEKCFRIYNFHDKKVTFKDYKI